MFKGDIGEAIQVIAQIMFYICLIIGIVVLIIGLFRFIGSIINYTSFSEALNCTLEDALEHKSLYGDAYYGRQQIKSGIFISLGSLVFLPIYALGDLTTTCQDIKKAMICLIEAQNNKEEDDDEE